MKKIIASLAIAATVVTPIAASAATWHSASVTLPRTGQWNTVDRTALSNTQGTYVKNNNYKVYSWIESSKGNQSGPTRTWNNDGAGAQYHSTGLKGAKVHASFKTSAVNYKTTTAYIEWAP
ncbi:hypothetical protein [Bacillus mycoides]|uniref:hypothetical protein n=1 Tax=Bacillus mycoides TaxID=1405 RepID=UPI002E1BB761|nr:hypothetical protein [Bacillus mycoides]